MTPQRPQRHCRVPGQDSPPYRVRVNVLSVLLTSSRLLKVRSDGGGGIEGVPLVGLARPHSGPPPPSPHHTCDGPRAHFPAVSSAEWASQLHTVGHATARSNSVSRAYVAPLYRDAPPRACPAQRNRLARISALHAAHAYARNVPYAFTFYLCAAPASLASSAASDASSPESRMAREDVGARCVSTDDTRKAH